MAFLAAVRLVACAAMDADIRPARRWMIASFISSRVNVPSAALRRQEEILLCNSNGIGPDISISKKAAKGLKVRVAAGEFKLVPGLLKQALEDHHCLRRPLDDCPARLGAGEGSQIKLTLGEVALKQVDHKAGVGAVRNPALELRVQVRSELGVQRQRQRDVEGLAGDSVRTFHYKGSS